MSSATSVNYQVPRKYCTSVYAIIKRLIAGLPDINRLQICQQQDRDVRPDFWSFRTDDLQLGDVPQRFQGDHEKDADAVRDHDLRADGTAHDDRLHRLRGPRGQGAGADGAPRHHLPHARQHQLHGAK